VGGPGGEWRLAFHDEFSGSSLDLATWRPNWFGSNDRQITEPVDPHSDSCVDPGMVGVSGGELRLNVERRACHGHPYAGGLVSSNPVGGGNFEYTYGYIEFRAILPNENGIWTALCINGQNWPDDGEVDVLESGLPSAAVQKWHYHDSTVGVAGGRVTIPDASTEWHTYAAYWEPGRVTWYFDGDPISTITTGPIGVPHYVLMNASDWEPSNPSGPATTRVDYVRVWQRYAPPVTRHAASARVSGRTLVVTAAKGVKDNLRITRPPGSRLRVTDNPAGSYAGSRLDAGAGCTQGGHHAANCHGAIDRVRVIAGDRADRVVNSAGIRSSLLGGSAADTLVGGSSRDTLVGGPGVDAIKGGKGDDRLRARDRTSDRAIDCGAGRDKADLDELPKDPGSAVKGCEAKRRR
jgi:beta-glucanase (GH16 family)